MVDVAADHHGQAFDLLLVRADGRSIEQRLGRVLVCAVAGIDDAGADALAEQQRRAGLGVANDHDVRIHGIQVHRGVDQRLAFDRGRRGSGEVDPVG